MSSRFTVVCGLILTVLSADWSPCAAGRLAQGQQDPMPASEIDAEFQDGATHLAGTILLPRTPGPHPAVVVLGGSDRSARGPGKQRLAQVLVDGGIAALLYDSPGTGRSSGNALLQTRVDRAREGVAAMEYLRSVDGIDPSRVGICGGSEGAGVALMAAALDPAAAFSIAISGGFGLTMMELSRYRIDAMGLRRGLSDEDILRAHALEEILYALLTGQDVLEWRLVRARTERWKNEPWDRLIAVVQSCRGDLSDAQQEEAWTSLKGILRDWMGEPWFDVAVPDRANLERVLAMNATMFFAFLERSPLATSAWYVSPEELDLLTGVRCAVLAVWGEQDDYLPPHRSAAWLGAVLEDSGNSDVTLHIFPDADHSIWNARANGFAQGFQGFLVEWLREQTGGMPKR
jgi:pimeloyl-ACP methyl ester carboxylesterase